MAQKRTAKEAFGKPKALSAVAVAKLAKQKRISAPEPPQTQPEPVDLATSIGSEAYDGHHVSSSALAAPAAEDLPPPASGPRKPDVQLSSFNPKNALSAPDYAHDTELSLKFNETVTVVGEYEVSVISGIATIYGAVLRPELGVARVYAPSTQALPQLQARQDGTKLRIGNVKSSIRKLERLSPHFRNIWTEDKLGSSSFALLKSTHDDSLQRSLGTLEIDQDMDAVLRTLSAKVMVEPRKPRIMAVGAKSAGKSTFNRILCNHIQSWTPAGKCQYLDLDPGQPEFGPSGQVSLVEVTASLLGPSFTHLADEGSMAYRMIRTHTIAATTFKHDPDHYRDCALDLIRRADTNLPLIVNSCGWVNGLGASVLAELASLLQISDIILLDPVDEDFVESLKASAIGAAFYGIPKQAPRPSARTPAEQRAMQMMAYFHGRSQHSRPSRFSGKPLSVVQPYNVSFDGPDQSIFAVASYGQAPKPEFLSEVLDGSVVALVVLESGHATSFEDAIGRTPDSIPYLLPAADGTTRTLDPKYSSCVGLGLIRGIDAASQSFQLVTPLDEDVVAGLAEKDVVLVRGGFDSPEWAYLEDLCYDRHGEADVEGRPWVSKREMVGVEGAVWRLRHPPLAPSAAASR